MIHKIATFLLPTKCPACRHWMVPYIDGFLVVCSLCGSSIRTIIGNEMDDYRNRYEKSRMNKID